MVTTILSLILTLQNSIVPINDLIKDSHVYDQKPIVIQAEVILEVLERDDYAWINVNDGSNAIGVYLPIEMTKDLDVFGDYNHIGDIVLVEGIFYRNCDEHGGEIDIHATSLTIVKEGYKVDREVSVWKFAIAFISFSLSIIVLFVYRNKRKDHRIEE
jgi:hypothetical protein